ncbi:MutS-related protein [Olivibacter domesticus]|uniref:DNA mismatch repair ATPase MutS n=1 Tax=Olivibacter domesticus TaxID=407022 RepID=A0A1H7YAA8_OLID1|nr:hypothetical protein [Olivibacter domesticus]SEM43166.1 DNA mismatch repair ATPase MutS [Olivibacter domesticus]
MDIPILTLYQEKLSVAKTEIDRLESLSNRYSIARLVLIILGGAIIFMVVQTELVWLTLLTSFIVLLIFIGLVAKQSKLDKQKEDREDELLVAQNELDHIEGKDGIYNDGSQFINDKHPYSSDLDLFGQKSLYHKINRTATPEGNNILATWLSDTSVRDNILLRQEAVKELVEDPSWCLNTLARLVFSLKEKRDFKSMLINYLNKSYYDFGNKTLQLYTKLSPWFILGFLLLSTFFSMFLQIAVFLIAINVLLTLGYARKVTLVAEGIGKTGNLLKRFGRAFAIIENREWYSKLFCEMLLLKSGNKNSQPAISKTIEELGILINKLDYRLNIFVSMFLNGFLLWDFRQVFAIIKWRKSHQYEMAQVFDDLSTMEALISISLLKINNPSWSWPIILSGHEHRFQAKELGHPLISPTVSVVNDYTLVDHRIALITGSNMAGKSTFLRTVGANVVLALCGAPVYAKELHLSVMNLVTYMRIRDSLNESTSTFKAELNRLEMILQVVSTIKNTFFLVDEMLRGTNSVDKYLGSKAVIEKLIKDGGVGIVATHDLQLARLEEEYQNYLKNYHFDIQVIDGEMLFDYQLKEGACTIFNASMLLKKIGIDISV